MRKRNWKEYNRQLVQRGSLTFLIDSKLLLSNPKRCKKTGRPLQFSDQIILMLMLVKVHFWLPYRGLEGFMKSLVAMSYSLVCKRAATLKDVLPPLSQCRSGVVLIDASGAKIVGEGEWKVKIHGKSKRRQWIKMHVALDPRSQEIVAESTTASYVKDGKMMKNLLEEVKGSLATV